LQKSDKINIHKKETLSTLLLKSDWDHRHGVTSLSCGFQLLGAGILIGYLVLSTIHFGFLVTVPVVLIRAEVSVIAYLYSLWRVSVTEPSCVQAFEARLDEAWNDQLNWSLIIKEIWIQRISSCFQWTPVIMMIMIYSKDIPYIPACPYGPSCILAI